MAWNLLKKSRRASKPARLYRFRPGLEGLEERALLAASGLVFTLDPAFSSLTNSGTLGAPPDLNMLMEQGPGSLTTSFTGTLATQYDPAAATLGFDLAGSAADANISGDWAPTEGDPLTEDVPPSMEPFTPADYGGVISGTIPIMGIPIPLTADLATRGLVAALTTTAPLALAGGSGTFTFASTQTVQITAGRLDYLVRGAAIGGREQLAGRSGTNLSPTPGTLQDLGNGTYRLTTPIRYTISDNLSGVPFTLTVEGSWQGIAIIPVVDLNGPATGSDFSVVGAGNNTPVALAASTATVTRTPTANLASATVTLTNRPDGTAESLAVDLGTSGLTQSYNATTGVLTITGSAAPSVYESVLRTATYRNTLATPSTADRIIQFAVRDNDDSSLIRTTTVTFSAPATLQVAPGSVSFSPASIAASFNRAIDPSVLNLYDGGGAGLGAADVTVESTTTGVAVKGTLLLNPGNTTITFVPTGGRLASDNYLLRLRSATDGFKDLSGGLLDGNGDNTAGDDFTLSFLISDGTNRILSLPDFARGPGQAVDLPATADNDLPITLSDGAGITSSQFTLAYNPALLNITGFVPGPGIPGASITLDTTTTPGEARVTITAPLNAGPVQLLRLLATVPDTAPYGSKQLLDLQQGSFSFNGGLVPVVDDDAIHVAAYFGDATGNGQVTSSDAQRAQRVAVGLDSGFAAFQLADPRIVADINGDGRTNSTDATQILREAIGIDQTSIPNRPNLPSLTPGGPDPFLNLPKRFIGRRGDTVTVPVNLDRPEGLDSVMLALSYDASRLELLSVARGSLTTDFALFDANINAAAGTVIIGGSSLEPLPARAPGSVALLTFRIKPDAPYGPIVLNLRQDLNGVSTALNEGGLDLIPDPSNTAGDILDGLITVLPRRQEIRQRIEDLIRQLPSPLPPRVVVEQRVEAFFRQASSRVSEGLAEVASLLTSRKGR